MPALPAALRIAPRGPLEAVVRVPGSKSLTNRALLTAALADGHSQLRGTLESDDTRVMRDALTALGVRVEQVGDDVRVTGAGGRLRAPQEALQVENSGTTARFLTAAAALADGAVVVDGNRRMRERPIDALVDALAALGVGCEILGHDGCPPVRVAGGGLPGGAIEMNASSSSQYVSAVLLVAPYAAGDVALRFAGGVLVSRPYVELTLQVMRDFGADAEWRGDSEIRVTSGHTYVGRDYAIEPDASAAAYPFCAAAIAGGRVRVVDVPRDSLQSDFQLLDILERMGCVVERGANHVEVQGPRDGLQGVDVDMNDLPDAVLALAAVALFAKGPTCIRNVANLRIKETDRLHALETELRKLGAEATATDDALEIVPGTLRGAEVDTYDDHRMAMAFALTGLRIPDIVIRDPSCVSKTWPDYFAMLEAL